MISSKVSAVIRRLLTSPCQSTWRPACQAYLHKLPQMTVIPCYNFSILGHIHDDNSQRIIVQDRMESSKVHHQEDVAVVKKAIAFTRSLSQNSVDGIVKHVSGDELLIEFGKFRWICKKPEDNKTNYKVGSHVRATKMLGNEEDEVSKSSILLIKEHIDKAKDEWSTFSFPWKLSRLEKMICAGLFVILVSTLSVYLCALYVILTVISVLLHGVVLSPSDFYSTIFQVRR